MPELRKLPAPTGGSLDTRLLLAKVKKAEIDAASAELDYQQKLGDVVDQRSVRQLAALIRTAHRDGLLALQASLPGQLDNVSAEQAREILTTAFRDHLATIQETLATCELGTTDPD